MTELAAVVAVELGELPGSEPWRSAVLTRAAALQEALRGGDERAAIAAAVAIGGLGEGSTPAGDDYLIGVLHALRVRAPRAAATDLVGRLAVGAAARTSTVSAAWLLAAARGEPSPVWRVLLDALDTGDDRAIRAAATAVRRTGHTSGAFSLRGFVDTLGCGMQ